MRILGAVRYLTYAILIVVAVQSHRSIRAIPVLLAQKDDYRGESPPPGCDWFSWCKSRSSPQISVMPAWGPVTEGLFFREFGKPDVQFELCQPIEDSGTSQGVQTILKTKYGDYHGKIKSCVWKRESRWIQAFVIKVGADSTVIDALSWGDGVKL